MSLESATESEMPSLPVDWQREPFPERETQWLAASFVAPAIQTGIAVLKADDFTSEGVVYPIAVTTEIGETVDDREYDLIAVKSDRAGVLQVARGLMERVSASFEGGSGSKVETVRSATEGSRQPVRVVSGGTSLESVFAGDCISETSECPRCNRHIAEGTPLVGFVTSTGVKWEITDFSCVDCSTMDKRWDDYTSGIQCMILPESGRTPQIIIEDIWAIADSG